MNAEQLLNFAQKIIQCTRKW